MASSRPVQSKEIGKESNHQPTNRNSTGQEMVKRNEKQKKKNDQGYRVLTVSFLYFRACNEQIRLLHTFTLIISPQLSAIFLKLLVAKFRFSFFHPFLALNVQAVDGQTAQYISKWICFCEIIIRATKMWPWALALCFQRNLDKVPRR